MVGVHGLEEPNGEILPMDVWSAYIARATAADLPHGFPEGDSSDFRIHCCDYYNSAF